MKSSHSLGQHRLAILLLLPQATIPVRDIPLVALPHISEDGSHIDAAYLFNNAAGFTTEDLYTKNALFTIMKKRNIILAAVLIISMFSVTGCIGKLGQKAPAPIYDNIDKSTRIVSTIVEGQEGNYSMSQLEYIKDNKRYSVFFNNNTRFALDFLKANTNPGDKIMSWWDNGHVIRGYAKRDPIIYSPCREILQTVAGGKWDETKLGPFSTKDDATNIAYALLADSPTITKGIMKRYNTTWMYVARIDMQKIGGMVILLGEDLKNFYDDSGDIKDSARGKVLFKMADGMALKGFEKEYEDEYATVYRLVE